MIIDFHGNCVRIHIEANELADGRVPITLPDGYSYEDIRIISVDNVNEIAPYLNISNNVSYHIPPVNAHSPSTIDLYVPNISQVAEVRFIIEKFGQIPDPDYFNNVFEPISVTGDDGNKYNVIPSDQFK